MTRAIATALVFAVFLCGPSETAADLPEASPEGHIERLEIEAASARVLQGRNARRQLVVTAVYNDGRRRDVTRNVRYRTNSPGIASVADDGLVTPLRDGQVTVTVVGPEGKTADISLKVIHCEDELPVSFKNEIVPIFTKLGCNAGGCHGKADGQNGFRLSLLGFYPDDDYEYLVHEDRGRRIFYADPEFSLLLQKPSNLLPHGGGRRMEPGSYEWQLVRRWIAQGTPRGSEDDPVLQKIETIPAVRELEFHSGQQLCVLAYYSDGSVRDVTRLAGYEPNDSEMATVASTGYVTSAEIPGEVAVMVRFQGAVSVFRAVLPQGIDVQETPPERSFVDQHVFARLKKLGIPPSPVCSDESFIRRVTIDITGRLPTVEETRSFLKNTDSAKRDRLIDRLLNSPDYADYFAAKWSAVLRNKRRNATDVPYTYSFHAWIRKAMLDNMPYDQFVRGILTATGDVSIHPPVAWYREVRTSTARMEDTAQLFLGLRLGCARCHHHPFERWSQQDYYGFEAFFSQVDMKSSKYNPQQNIRDAVYVKAIAPKARNPRTEQDVPPTGLGDAPMQIEPWEDARHRLVDWMTDRKNPFFARALVNRYWKHFLGRGIVDPEDDLRVTNPPTNPELLDALAEHFVKSGYNLKDLVRLICQSSTYQLSSEPTEGNRADRQNFSSFYPRRLHAEVLHDAIDQVTGARSGFPGIPRGTRAVQLPDNGFNNYFLQVFGKPQAESACECERSVEANLSQSLHLLNSSDVQNRIRTGDGQALRYARDKETSDDDKIRELWLAAFSRSPTDTELNFVLSQLKSYDNPQAAWEDVIWAVVNTKEFQFVR